MMCAPPRDIADLRTPWIDSPFFEALLARRDFDAETRELVRTYARDGFLTFDPQIPDFDAVAGRIIEALSKRESGAANLLHGGSANKDPARTRHSQVMH